MMTNLQKGKKMDCLERRRDTIGLGLNNRAGSRFIRPCFSPRVTIIHHAVEECTASRNGTRLAVFFAACAINCRRNVGTKKRSRLVRFIVDTHRSFETESAEAAARIYVSVAKRAAATPREIRFGRPNCLNF